jgi:hypothetical protein
VDGRQVSRYDADWPLVTLWLSAHSVAEPKEVMGKVIALVKALNA